MASEVRKGPIQEIFNCPLAHYFTPSENPFPKEACSDHAGIQFKVISNKSEINCSSLNIAGWRMVKWMDFGCNDQDKKTSGMHLSNLISLSL